jgi:macrolide transport system ATP-binding/permease protein
MAALIEIRDITKRYLLGDVEVRALNGANLTISQGEFVAIMGSSGSGKSTLMNILGCLDKPTSGQYLLAGLDVSQLDEPTLAMIRSRYIGFVFQSFNLLARASALENIELPLFYSGWTSEARSRAPSLLARVGLNGREQSHPSQLSGGEQQRVAIARALINQPPILLADEPTGNLDSRNSAEIMEIFRKLNRDQELTVILVTHEVDVANYADRIVTFRDGVVVSDTNASHLQTGSSLSERPDQSVQADEESASEPGNEFLAFASMTMRAATRALRRNKMRAVLTMLGIFIGVAAVVAMVAVGEGARISVEEKIKSLGTNLVVVLPGTTTSGGVRAGSGSNSRLTVQDAQAIGRDDPAVTMVAYYIHQAAQVVSGDRNWSTLVVGTTPNYFAVRDWPLTSGRPFTEDEQRSAATVCLLGQTVVTNLFGDSLDPVGAVIRVKNVTFHVIGVLAAKGQSNTGHDQDDLIVIPFETAERKVLGTAAPSAVALTSTQAQFDSYAGRLNALGTSAKIKGKINAIYAKASDADSIDSAIDQLTRTLRARHHVAAGKSDDFTVSNLADIARASADASEVMTLLLAAVASISLLVGGIGIMNIMLVSVTERTREIGIRMAIGARRMHILQQFLVESVLLSVMGGAAGAILGIVASKAISVIASWPTLISPTAVIGGFVFSVIVGVFFGYYPARKASLLNPIEALRYE